ncbi:MAG TPA: FCD domain-containing protein, partial [Anaerolineae bacterium]|nr:FCD domain-containing protein [Anaerolineae bacterium]
LTELRNVPDGNGKALMSIDERFHELLYRAADNEFLTDTLRRLHALSFRIWHVVLDRLGSVRGAMEQHVQIAEAIKEGDGTRAEILVQQHVSGFQQEIKDAL